MSEENAPQLYRDGTPVYPHFSRQWWLQMEYALNKLADDYSARSPMGRMFRAFAAWSGRKAVHARPADL